MAVILSFHFEKRNMPAFFSRYGKIKIGPMEKTNSSGTKLRLRIVIFSAHSPPICTAAIVKTVAITRLLFPRRLNTPVSNPVAAININDKL